MIKQILRDMLAKMQTRKTDRIFQSTMSLYLYASLGSMAFAVYYTLLGYYQLAFPIAVTGGLFLTCVALYSRDLRNITHPISFISISLLIISSTYLMGLDYGGFYFILGAVTLYFYMDRSILVKAIFVFLCLVEYITVQVYFADLTPVYTISDNALAVYEQMNIWIAFGAVAYTLISYRNAANKNDSRQNEIHKKINHLANSDLLTGIANRRGVNQKLESMISESKESSGSFVMGLVDIDDFKRINDTYGHQCGDEVLKYTSILMQSTLRKSDFIGRWGGEEFLIILPDTELEKGIESLERVRETLSKNVFNHYGKQIQVTVTIGAAVFKNNLSLSDLIQRVDERMYSGKQRGKNCVIGVSVPVNDAAPIV